MAIRNQGKVIEIKMTAPIMLENVLRNMRKESAMT
jgi:hypothetical protein